ncbi:8173_t:CDS:2 [Diversispora eburnea]|uniref:8173_t:CDS:1 n=1 Tax=Diversispora eburnea TaxID=1213867 RepID=A0A9N8ZXA1_9GLOM|nr:8173_t:CDS:2 [Diversispora eburnea]
MSQEAVYCPASHSSTRIIYDKRKNYIRIESGYCKLCNKEHFSQEFGTWSSGNVLIDINIKQSIEDIMNKMTFEISNTHSSKNEKMSPNLENGPRFSDVAIVMEAENSTTHIKDRLQNAKSPYSNADY